MNTELEELRAERDRLVAALAEAEDRFSAVLAGLEDVVYSTSVDGKTVHFISDACQAVYARPAAAFLCSAGLCNEVIHPEDRDRVAGESDRLVTGEPFDSRYRILRPDETVRWVHDRATLVRDPSGNPVRINGIMTDITALQESEERFRVVVGNIPGSVYRSEIAPPYRDIFLSAGIESISGYRAEEYFEPGGPSCGALIMPEDLAAVDAAVSAAVAERRPFRVRYRIRHRDGSIRWVSDQGRATYAADGTPLYLDGVHLDITAQVEAETAARTHDERLRAILENEPECVKLVDRQGNLLEMNPAGLRMIEADSMEQVVGHSLSSLVVPADQAAFRQMIADVFRGEARTFTFGITGLRGTQRILETHSVPLRVSPANQTVTALLGVTRDVTDRQRAAEALRESEQRFRTLVASVPGAVYVSEIEPPWRDTFMSEGVRAITGRPAEDFLRPDGPTFGEITLAEDLPQVTREVARGVAAHEVIAIRYRVRHADGTVRWVLDQGRAAYDASGQPKFVTGVIIDITDRMLAEEALKASQARLLEAQRIAIVGNWELDIPTGTLHWSEETYRIFELDPKDFAGTYTALLDAIHPEDRALADRTFAKAVEQRTPYDSVHRLLMRDGRVKFVHERAVTDYDAAGGPVRSAGTVQDITERHRAEQARLSLEDQLRESQKMEAMGTLAGGIAHDFNNILAAIVGHSELLSEDLAPSSALQQEVSGVLIAARRARDLVQQILTFSRRGARERTLTAILPVVREALLLLRSTLPSTIEIRTDLASGLPLVLADPTQVHQVVVNLATNAAHAMREQGGFLSVWLGVTQVNEAMVRSFAPQHDGPHVCLRVSDTGHGIDRETMGRIFEPFFTTKERGEGTGLGLAVVHGIVESHDGFVTVESEPGKGTTVSVYFPGSVGTHEEPAKDEESTPRGRGERVLVLDDEPALVDVACRLLISLGYRATGYQHPAEALASLRQDPGQFDLVLSDLTMPGMNGLEFAARLREIRPDIPMVLASGYGGAVDPESLRRSGIRELLPKPFVLSTLAGAVHRHLQVRS